MCEFSFVWPLCQATFSLFIFFSFFYLFYLYHGVVCSLESVKVVYLPVFITGRMTSGVGSLDFLTRRHAVKIDSKASVEDCSLAVGEVVGCENVVSASRMNGAVVVFMKTVELANIAVESGVVIDNAFVSVLPLSTPKKVILSNVPPFIKNEALAQMLERYGKLVSPIKMIQIGCKSPLLKHVVSFRRFVFMVLKDNNEELDLTFNFKHGEFNYAIFATTNNMRCLSCGELGHFVRACPRKDKSNHNVPSVSVEKAGEEEVVQAVREELPTTSNVVRENNAQKPVDLSADAAASKQMGDERQTVVEMEDSVSDKIQSVNGSGDKQSLDKNQEIEMAGDNCLMEEQDECVFKTPQKRRMKPRHYSKSKRTDKVDLSQTDTESETDLSECSISFNQSQDELPNHSYNIDDIRLFLRVTKNARNVRITEYFPDLEQFVEKAKIFKSEGLFSDQEIYRLKKILTKVNVQLGINVGKEMQ